MDTPTIEHVVTLWMTNDIPARMIYAGRRWRVTDTRTRLRHSTRTRLRHSTRTVPLDEPHHGLYGWRFQGTDDDGISLVLDVYKGEEGWHAHRC